METDPAIDLQKLIESLPETTVVVNQEGKIVLVNVQAESLFGFPRQELLNQPLEILLPERFRTEHIQKRIRYFANPLGAEKDRSRTDGRKGAAG